MTRYIRAVTGTPEPDDIGRIIRYMFSDNSVARDNHTINTAGWDLVNFMRNPVFLWAHDASALPIGRVVDIGVVGERLMGNVEYIGRDEYPFADTVYQMVRNGFLNATSVCWDPKDWKFSTDKGRAGGIDFLKQELLEVSQVPVPAMPTALAVARQAGIDTQPMVEWAERVLDTGGMLMMPRGELEALRRAAKMPGRSNIRQRAVPGGLKRGLYSVSALACLVNELGYVTDTANWEKDYEGDDSKVPAMLLDALKMLGAALVAMTQEEVAELLAGLAGETVDLADDLAAVDYAAAATTPAQRLLRGLELTMRRALAPRSNIALVEQFVRAGKVLSADNEKTIRSAHGMISDAADLLMGVCDAANGDSGDDDNARRLRLARARVRKAAALDG